MLIKKNLRLSNMTVAPISMVHQNNDMKYTTCFSVSHKRRGYRTSWPVKDVNGSSFPNMDPTSEAYGKQP
jgi:hypothetical protein